VILISVRARRPSSSTKFYIAVDTGMSPNPYILLRNLITPNRWFARNDTPAQKSKGRIEHWDEPVRGVYEYIPGRGWFLIAVDSDDGDKLDKPVPLTYCRVLHRYFLKDEFESRKKWGVVTDEHGNTKKGVLFRLDDGITWIYCWNEVGEFDVCKRKLQYCIDSKTGKFRIKNSADCREASYRSSESTTLQGSASPNLAAATSSLRSFVEGDVHSTPRDHTSLPSTQPSTRPVSRRESSYGSGLHGLAKQKGATPPIPTKSETVGLDAPELDRRLRKLEEV
jgi:hypothetical protein